MTKLEEKLEQLEAWNMCGDSKPASPRFAKVLSALRLALKQRDLSIYNQQAYLGMNNQKEISNKFDTEILKVLGE